MQSTENWLPVVGYEGKYEVSDLGRVRSLPRYAPAGFLANRFYPGVVLKSVVSRKHGRATVSIHGADGKQKTRLVHHLVLEAFVGSRPDGTEGCHWDGDPANNRLSNLRWDTHVANEADKVRHRTHNNTVKTHCPQGHALVSPNLVLAELRKGGRKCMACNRARAWAHKMGIPFDRAVADDRYARIMGAASKG